MPDQTRADCAKDGAFLATKLGWVPIVDRAQTFDLVWRAECNTGVSFATGSNGVLYLLLRQDIGGSRFETPDGRLIDRVEPPPTTVLCPLADQAQCGQAFTAYVHASVVAAIAGSTKLAEFAAHRPGR